MPVSPNYQAINPRNPYAEEAARYGPERGLWSVLGRAIRSTVPERANVNYNKDAPISDENLPFQKPGFFRALAGDRGADFNRAARLNALDLDTNEELGDRQTQAYTDAVNTENKAGMERDQLGWMQRQVQGWLDNKRRMEALRERIKADYGVGKARNAAMVDAATIRAQPQPPRALAPESASYFQEKARELKMNNDARVARENRRGQTQTVQPAKDSLIKTLLKNAIGGGQVPQASPQTGMPAPIPEGEIVIDPQDLQGLGGGVQQTPGLNSLLTRPDETDNIQLAPEDWDTF